MSSSRSAFTPYPGRNGVPECARCRREDSPTSRLKRCTGCSVTMYCSKECQKGDWYRHKLVCRNTDSLAPEDNLMDPSQLAATGYPAVTTFNSALMDWQEAQSYALSSITTATCHLNGGLDRNLGTQSDRVLMVRVTVRNDVPASERNAGNAFKLLDVAMVNKGDTGLAGPAWDESLREFERTVNRLREELSDGTIAGLMPGVLVVVNTGMIIMRHHLVHRRTADGHVRNPQTRAAFNDLVRMCSNAINAGYVLRPSKDYRPYVGILVRRKRTWQWEDKKDWNWDVDGASLLPPSTSTSGLDPRGVWKEFWGLQEIAELFLSSSV
ncbi:hypothetical protein PYCCODRAFT_1429139 [Trametes coccinea BRFM310]|uniref:MYND-type domain-containing protein n=1 Tax=Trametes coccinea (strain BRFM310) TaxID=1353009 RepID=A0A1Y2I5F9_TRAC3|nr:hypothetical protein PYCCODRAFT_1429139 [Trametes coccinea BRFM310]